MKSVPFPPSVPIDAAITRKLYKIVLVVICATCLALLQLEQCWMSPYVKWTALMESTLDPRAGSELAERGIMIVLGEATKDNTKRNFWFKQGVPLSQNYDWFNQIKDYHSRCKSLFPVWPLSAEERDTYLTAVASSILSMLSLNHISITAGKFG